VLLADASIVPGEMQGSNVVADMDATYVVCLCRDHRIRGT